MLERRFIREHLERAACYKCGESLGGAKLHTISDAPVALVAHAVCPKCQSESMLTITPSGSGVVPLVSDLTGIEIKKFIDEKSVTYDELLDFHRMLEKDTIWNLLRKKGKNSVKKLTP
ncbi:MAG: hypothetical protein UU80_C0014G0008 [candidate division WWE3 bacterium GW2011_GWA1_41_8]|uniref:Uncharacterized protein n=2 Tax=Katanobacteria TaxID=422282 RepID=A0A0G1A9Q0_UNCKA|nr:MAG: hypothetical protein UU72_C0009G0024 [candidate division WWE3 bacterium GW2011_GWB1_41_6]KKS22053.1 MAG: hypothetical protein UU80_C0014G0008 [candidate division WWE3 bacterium GW2011_GWA1_41_8]